MEMIKVSKEEYEKMKMQLSKLKELEKVDFDLVRQFKNSLEDVKSGKVEPISESALWSEKSLAKTWLNQEEDEIWKDL